MSQKHLAILTQPFLDLILDGKKTIESRFTKVRCLPYNRIAAGDIVIMKKSGGLVLGEFTVSKVKTFTDTTPDDISKIAGKYGREIGSDVQDDFWECRQKTKYVTLMYISNPVRYESPYPFPKKDRRGWVLLD